MTRTFQLGKLQPIPAGRKTTGERYNLNLTVDVNNMLNHLNQDVFVGNLASPLLGQ